MKIKEWEKIYKYLDLAREGKKNAVKHEGVAVVTSVDCALETDPKVLEMGIGKIGSQKKNRDNTKYSNVKNGQNIES